jgi:SlyX protein
MNAEALERIETKIAFLERANAELSDVVFRQHQEIEVLRAQLLALCERVGSMRTEEGGQTPEDERPPHY